ncbi:APC family permease [Boudabousia liubingyangii]|uniref:APC family permease n=1 Tax=Boudabousia liubingyangii TaxID=1921764 RepID=UPI000ADBF602|nr:APC family permease [Boudabousia liubingyangii]
MHDVLRKVKRVLVGKPVRSSQLSQTLLPKSLALPAFAADALSSIAYAPDEIFLTLAIAGVGATLLSPWIAVAVAVLLGIVVLSYRQTVHAYPEGGGDYHVVTKNLGHQPGLIVASALVVDYFLTVAVSISAGATYLTTTFDNLAPYRTLIALGIVALLVLAHLRGLRESSLGFAIPTYFYMAVVFVLVAVGLIKESHGTLGQAPTAAYDLIPDPAYSGTVMALGGMILVARAFSSGCVMLTGVEAVSNGVPAFQKPKSKNAATTLGLIGVISIGMLLSVVHLATVTGVKYVENPSKQLLLNGEPVASDLVLDPVLGQLAGVVFNDNRTASIIVSVATGLILLLAANTAFNGFPVLASVLSRDSFLPHQLYKRGDRLSYSNGILALGGGAMLLIFVLEGNVTTLVHMYIVGVFISFTLSQFGMVKHWKRALRTEIDAVKRSRYKRSQIINTIGYLATGFVLLIVFLTRFTQGAWAALVLMALLYTLMLVISRHYQKTKAELTAPDLAASRILPSRVHAVVLVSSLNRPAMRAISYARASNPTSAEILSVSLEESEMSTLKSQWELSGLPVPLTFVDSPYRDITRPVLRYIRNWRRRNPSDLVVVYIPEYLVEHWWQNILHNHTALRLKTSLLFTPGVVVCAVPWRLGHENRDTSLVKIIKPGKEQNES